MLKHFNGAKAKDMKSYVIPTVEKKPDNIILNIGTNNLENIDTPEEITMGTLSNNMEKGYKQHFYIWYYPKICKLNEKASKVNRILRHQCEKYMFYRE